MSETITTLSLLIVFQTVFYDILSKDVSLFIKKEGYGKQSYVSLGIYKRELLRTSSKVVFLFIS